MKIKVEADTDHLTSPSNTLIFESEIRLPKRKRNTMNANTPVSSIMTKDLVTVQPEDSFTTLKKYFDEKDFHHLPVVESGGKLVGIISKEDLYKTAYALMLQTTGKTYSKRQMESIKARDVMTQYPIYLDPDDSIGLAADIFLANKFHALPIVEDDILVGLVTAHDLLRFGFSETLGTVSSER